MKKIIYLFSFLITLSCSDNSFINDCFPGVIMNTSIDSSLPEFNTRNENLLIPENNLLVQGGKSENIIAGRNILILRVGSSGYRAFDLQCPEGSCNSPMSFDGVIIKCPCDGKEYNYLQGGAPKDGKGCAALQYIVTNIGGSILRISL